MSKMSAVPSLLIVGFYAATIMLMSAGVVLVSAQTATVTPVEKYFLPIGEAALLESMDKVNYRAAAPLNSMNSITIAADGTYIWYDHWVSQQADSGFSGIFICCVATAETQLYVFYHATFLTNIIGGRLRDLHRRTDAALVGNLGRQQRRQRMCTGHRPVHGRQRLLVCRRRSHPRELGSSSPRRQRHPVRRW